MEQNDNQDECYLCGGSGEVVFVAHGDPEQRQDCFGCPACIARERDELEQELQLYRALCHGYTLDEMGRMSLTFKAQIDVLRGRVAVPEDPTAAMCDAFLREFDTYLPRATFEDGYRAMLEAAK